MNTAEVEVLEIGSRDVNGGVRDLFHGRYLGVDLVEGPGVDQVVDAEGMPFADGWFDLVVCLEMLEHCRRPWKAAAEMARVLVPGGGLILSCRGYDARGCWPVHEEPVDLWRFSKAGLRGILTDAGFGSVGVSVDLEGPGWLVTAAR